MPAPLTIIVNPAAGGGSHRQQVERAVGLFSSKGKEVRVLETCVGADLADRAAQALKDGAEAVGAAGGDGTVNAIANVIAGTDIPMGVLPIGTLNHFARDIGMPTDLEGAVAVLASGHTIRVDVCEVNDRIFVNNSSLGLYPLLVRKREGWQRMGHKKWPAFLWAAAAVLRRYPFLDVRLQMDGRELRRRTPLVFIGNNQYTLEGLRVGSRASLSAGAMCVYVTHRTGRWGLLRLSLSALLGRLHRHKNFDSFSTVELWIETRRKRAPLSLDGEVTDLGPRLHYRIRPGDLRVIAPAPQS